MRRSVFFGRLRHPKYPNAAARDDSVVPVTVGEMAFSEGDYTSAEKHYREALVSYPGYVQALASLGRVRAAQGDLAGAIEPYEEAVWRFPDPTLSEPWEIYTIWRAVREKRRRNMPWWNRSATLAR